MNSQNKNKNQNYAANHVKQKEYQNVNTTIFVHNSILNK